MDRIAFQLGAITIYWYGIFVSLGFVVAYLVMHWKAGKMDIPQHKVSDLCFAAMIGGILGARVFYVILNYGEYASNPIEIIRIDHGGLVFYGGFFGATIALVWLIQKLELSFWAVADLFAVSASTWPKHWTNWLLKLTGVVLESPLPHGSAISIRRTVLFG